jgi:fumarate hydratase class II
LKCRKCLLGCANRTFIAAFQYWSGQNAARIDSCFRILKKAAALVNEDLGKLPHEKLNSLSRPPKRSSQEDSTSIFLYAYGRRQWYQTNMNANEVIANRAIEIAGGVMGSKKPVHPNDDVNMSQSSNDAFPTAMYIAAASRLHNDLIPAIGQMRDAIAAKAQEFCRRRKIGRTHLQDATTAHGRAGNRRLGQFTDAGPGMAETGTGWALRFSHRRYLQLVQG